jgi:hypothetical protein
MVNRKLHEPDVPDRVRALALDIAHRLRPVCANMPDEDMLELSTRMAAVELEYFEPAPPAHRPRRRAAHG